MTQWKSTARTVCEEDSALCRIIAKVYPPIKESKARKLLSECTPGDPKTRQHFWLFPLFAT